MKFKATDEELAAIMAKAFNASIPVGMGFIHFKPEKKTADDFLKHAAEVNAQDNANLYLDYVEGRMVKLSLWKKEGAWEIPESTPRSDYQSWASHYPSYKALVESAVTVEV